MNTKSVILEGAQLPQALKDAISGAGKDFFACRITHETKQVALVSIDWLPLIMRLEAQRFTEVEFDELCQVLIDADGKIATTLAFTNWIKRLE